MIRFAKSCNHLSLHELTTDITPHTIETMVVVNAVVRIISAIEAACYQRLLTFYTMSTIIYIIQICENQTRTQILQ